MRSAVLPLLVCLQWCGTSWAWSHISKSELKSTLTSPDHVLIAFVSPEEEKSKALESEWTAAVENGGEKLVSFDCARNMATCHELGVKSFPEIHLFRDDRHATQYKGPWRAAAFHHFVARIKRSITMGITTDNLASFKTSDEIVFLAYDLDWISQEDFIKVAREYQEEFTFGVTSSDIELPSGVTPPAVVCYKQVDGDSLTFSSFGNTDEFEKWIKKASRPVISELTTLNHQRLLHRGWPIVYLFAATEPERQHLRKRLYKFAKNYYDSMTAVIVDPAQFSDLPAKLGLEPGAYPAGAVHQLSKDRIFPYPKGRPLTPGALQQWGLDVYQGRIKPWTPPGVTTAYEDLKLTGVKATQRVSIAKGWPGVNIRVAGRDEL